MKKITLYLFLFLSFSLVAQEKSNHNIITEDLIEFMAINSNSELIPVNIILADKYPTSQLNNQLKNSTRANRRKLVVNELKSFTKQSQKNLLSYLSSKAAENQVTQVNSLWITNIISCKATEQVINQLSLRDDISIIDHDEIRNMLIGEETGVPAQSNSIRGTREITYNVSKVNAPAVWDLGYTGQGVVVAVLDVGVNYNHVDLADHMWEDPDYPFHGYDFAYNDNDPMDNHGHGTHCAGTVAGDGTAGSQTGMAPDAKIMALKILNDTGGGAESDSWEAIQFTVDNGGDIMSMSIGWQHSWNPQRATWRNALDNALAAGVIASIAAGNEGGSINNPDDVRTPGDCPPPWLNPDQVLQGGISSVVCIGATDASDNIAYFSSRGPSSWETINPYNDYPFNPETGLIRPDVSAPGVNIKSCNTFNINGYTTMSGTSMATPGVAGVMALMLSRAPNLTPDAIDIALETTAVDLGTPGKDNVFGSGRVDALEAINNLIEIFSPTGFLANTNQETGLSTLTWNHVGGMGFQYFKIYKNGEEIDTTSSMTYEDQLTEYGYFTYSITAFYGSNESDAATRQTQWGSSSIEIMPDSFTAIVNPDSTAQQTMLIKNVGVLDLTFSLPPFFRNIGIVDWISIEPDNGTIAVGDSMAVTLTFNAEGYSLGLYADSITFISNDIENNHFSVNVDMIVDNLNINASATPETICYGDSTQLITNTSGGFGNFTYSWTSLPEGFTSTEPNPTIKPIENTEYFVSVSDSLLTLDASTMVTVFSLPVVDLGEDQVLCGESQYELDAGNPGDNYLWSNNDTTQTIIATGTNETIYWAEVTNNNGCSSSDTVYINFASIPEVNLGNDTTVCGGATITLNAGNSGSTYYWSNGETSQAIETDTLGFGYGEQDISVEVTNESGCFNTSNISIVFVNCTGIDEFSSISLMNYPNPTTGLFKIELKSDINNYVDISILNTAGAVIYKLDNIFVSGFYTQNINISNFADGIYTIVISNNEESTSQKIILRK